MRELSRTEIFLRMRSPQRVQSSWLLIVVWVLSVGAFRTHRAVEDKKDAPFTFLVCVLCHCVSADPPQWLTTAARPGSHSPGSHAQCQSQAEESVLEASPIS